jgi:hypothetical protein
VLFLACASVICCFVLILKEWLGGHKTPIAKWIYPIFCFLIEFFLTSLVLSQYK